MTLKEKWEEYRSANLRGCENIHSLEIAFEQLFQRTFYAGAAAALWEDGEEAYDMQAEIDAFRRQK